MTHEGANILATLIKVQALKRHNEAWKDSLRYGRPDLDSMFGIRRITINSNQSIGDKGVQALSDAFKSDLWLKALDLQDCGITTTGANYLLDGLKFNAMMHVLDVRLNLDIDRDTLQKIMEQVMINSSGNNTEYEWMDLTQTASINSINPSTAQTPPRHQEPSSSENQNGRKIKKRRNTNASFTKKAQFIASTTTSKMKRCKSTGSVICNKSPTICNTKGGVPWRAAARANRYRASTSSAFRKAAGLSSSNNDGDEYDDDVDEDEGVNDNCDNAELTMNQQGRNYVMASSTFDYDKFASMSKNNKQQRRVASSESLSKTEFVSNLDKIKNISVKDLLLILQKEQESKTQLEDILLQLQDENTKLKSQISVYKSKVDHQQHQINALSSKQSNTSNLNRTLLEDDKALEIIELTLYKYQNFLDFLRNAGLGVSLTLEK